jgi:ribonuclease HI
MEVSMFTDGGARGNPGPAAIGVVIKDNKHKVIHKVGKYIGVGTNNDAEYSALIEGLVFLAGLNYSRVICHLDSELVVKQLNGLYKVKNVKIKKHWNRIKVLEKNFSHIEYKHVKREKNHEADELVNQVLDSAPMQ